MGTALMSLPDSGIIALVVAAIGAFTTGIANLFAMYWQYQREGRAHQWIVDKEDRDNAHRQAMALQTQQTIATKIDKTDENVAAFAEIANNVNNKLVAIGEVRMRKDAKTEERRANVSEDTNATAHRIEDKLET
jgi:hypothetical protein